MTPDPKGPISASLYIKMLVFQAVVGPVTMLAVHLMQHGELEPGPAVTAIGLAVAVAAAAGLLYATLRVRPQLPSRPAGVAPDRYLEDRHALAAAAHLWIVTGAAGVGCWFSYGYTGSLASAVMGVVAFVVYLTLRPAALAAYAARLSNRGHR